LRSLPLSVNQRHVAFGAPVEMHWLEIFHIHGRASPLRTLSQARRAVE
jgi:hypothetical protein